MKLTKILFSAVTAVGMTVSAMPALAEWAPDGPLKIEVGFGPGGSTDTMGRVLGQVIEKNTGWSVIVENKPGAGGTAMFTAISQRPVNANIVGMGVSPPLLTNLVKRPDSLPFDLDSFEYISSLARAQVALVARKDAPFDDIAGLIEHSKSTGVPLAFGSSAQKAVMEYVAEKSGADFRYVATKGGAETAALILGDQVQAGFSTGEHLQYLETGDMKMILSLNDARHSYAPETETITEAGFAVFVDPIFFFATRKGIDADAKAMLVKVFSEALQSEEVKTIVQNSTQGPIVDLGPDGLRKALYNGLASTKLLFGK